MRKSNIALGISAALAVQGLLDPTTAAAQGVRASTQPQNAPSTLRAPAGSVLYDQSGTAANGAPSQNFSSALDAYDNASADDFVVTDTNGWDISQFNFQVSATADPSSATYDINVYNDAAGLPGTLTSCTYSALAGTITGGTNLAVTLPSACHLDPGTYWVSEVANLDYGTGGQLFWSDDDPANAAINSPGVFQNPGDGFGSGCTTWTPLASCGGASPVGGGSNNFLFQVLGAVSGGGGGCTAGGICLDVTVALDNGDPNQCTGGDSADIDMGDSVNYCYVVTNDSGIELDYHTLMDNIDGTIFSLLNQPLADGASLQYNRVVPFNTPGTTNVTSTWTAQDLPPGYLATPTSGGPPITDRIFCDGFDGVPCDNGGGGGFVDITATGTATGLTDDGTTDLTMPFSFNFYGATTNQLCVSNNGGILVGVTGCSLSYDNNAAGNLPVAGLGAAILPLWDDFDAESGDVYYATVGTAPNRQFVIEWFDRVHYSGGDNADGATFEVIINEADGSIQFEYLDVTYEDQTGLSGDPADCSDGVCATIGLQQNDTTANEYSFLTASIDDGTGIDWTATSPQIFTDDDTVSVHVGAPDIDVVPTSVTGTTPEGGTSATTLDISNVGDRDLDWTTEEAPPAAHFPDEPRPAVLVGDPRDATSALRAPAPLKPYSGPSTTQQRILGAIVPAYGCLFSSSTTCDYVNFDATAPGTVNTIAPESTAYYTGAFYNNDFTKEYVVSYPAGILETVDTVTGAVTSIGPTGLGDSGRGFTSDPVTATLYGTDVPSAAESDLVTFDPLTGAATTVAPITGVGASGYSIVMAVVVDSNGLMYGIEIVSDQLIAIDKTTGAATNIGPIGFDTSYAQGLSFDYSTGTLYAASYDLATGAQNIYTVDTTTGAYTLVGPVASGASQLGAFSVAIGAGPCSDPQDLPWVSLAPTSGTTGPGGTSPVTVTFDATGQTEGDVLSGTLCVNSNDPDEATVEVPVEMTVGPAGTGGGVVDSGVLDLAIPQTTAGLYIDWLTGCTATSSAGCANGYDFNPYGSTSLLFYSFVDHDSHCVSADDTNCDVLSVGDTVGPASTFDTTFGNAANFRAGGTAYLGFSFTNTDTGITNYGYVRITTTGPNGVPMTLNEYWYDNTGAAITIAP